MYYNAPYIRVEWNTPMPSSRRAYPNIVLASHNYEFLPQDEDNSGISLYPELLENSSYSNSQEKRKVNYFLDLLNSSNFKQKFRKKIGLILFIWNN